MPDAPRPEKTPKAKTPNSSANSRLDPRWIVGGVLFVLVVIFILENREPTSIRLLIPLVTMPQWAALTMTLIIGLIIGLLISRRRR